MKCPSFSFEKRVLCIQLTLGTQAGKIDVFAIDKPGTILQFPSENTIENTSLRYLRFGKSVLVSMRVIFRQQADNGLGFSAAAKPCSKGAIKP